MNPNNKVNTFINILCDLIINKLGQLSYRQLAPVPHQSLCPCFVITLRISSTNQVSRSQTAFSVLIKTGRLYIVSVYSIINLRRAPEWQGIWRCKQNLLDIRYSLVYCCKMVNSCCAYGCRNRMDKRKSVAFFVSPLNGRKRREGKCGFEH